MKRYWLPRMLLEDTLSRPELGFVRIIIVTLKANPSELLGSCFSESVVFLFEVLTRRPW